MWWKLFIYILLMIGFITIVGYYIGSWFALKHKLFRSKLNHLDYLIRNASFIDKKEIENLFIEVKKFDCNALEEKEIEELENLFHERFYT